MLPDATRLIEQAKVLHRQGRLSEAMSIYGAVMSSEPRRAEPHYLAALAHYQQGNATECHRLVSRALELEPNAAPAQELLAGTLLALDRPAEALPICDRLLAKSPDNVGMACNRAVILGKLDRIDEAIAQYDDVLKRRPEVGTARLDRGTLLARRQRYQEALADFDQILAAVPNHLDALRNRGNVLVKLDRRPEALASYDRILAARPDDVDALSNRGATLRALDRADEALASYERALAANPTHPNALFNHANMLYETGRVEAALDLYDRLLAVVPDDVDALAARRNALIRLNRHAEALAAIERSLSIKPRDADALYYRGVVLDELDRNDEAAASYAEALAVDPNHIRAKLGRCISALPILYTDEPEIARRRQDYAQRLETLRRDVAPAPAAFADAVGLRQPFYLAYQAQNDRDLQATYGGIISDIMAARYPAAAPAPPPQPGEPVRIGIVSGFFRNHTVWKLLLKGWLTQLDRKRFRVFGYDTGAPADDDTRAAEVLCERFTRGPVTVDGWRRAILDDRPHVLIYPEIGMDPFAAPLAAQRLARVQCVAMGHPDTTGLRTIDYFLTGALLEPPDAEQLYTERLTRLPNLSIYYEPQPASDQPTERDEFAQQNGLRATGKRFWCGQSLFKYLPQYDEVFPRIAKEVGDCQFVFIRHQGPERITDLFFERLERAFTAHGLAARDYCTMLPRLTFSGFFTAIGCCHIILDSIGWSGCTSTLEALPHDLPNVTLPGPLMRSRRTAAILNMMGVTETIADTVDGYVATAARLARDPAWHAEAKARMAAGKDRVYRDEACIAALNDFLDRAARAPDGVPLAAE
jgi:predicted O-linked N-acetylglucosamine transferase (SPINDLY family)